MFLYHLTCEKFLPDILKNGLIPNDKNINSGSNNYVYLTSRLDGLEIYTYKNNISKYGNVVLLEIDSTNLYLEADPDDTDLECGEYQFVSEHIPVDNIINIKKEVL